MGIRLDRIKKSFPEFNIEINLTVNRGELVTLLGPSGCGKTTTLGLISGILSPDRGDIFIGSSRVTDMPVWQRDIGIVFQDYALFPHMNVLANIAYGLKARKTDSRTISDISNRMLNLVHLEGYGKRKVESLSGGEKQRTALARALAPSPRLLLLDEPLSALDAKLRRGLRREIREIQQKLGITTIYVTHDQEEALSISDRIVLINRGKIEQTGTPWEIYNRPSTKFCGEFLGDSNTIPCDVKSCSPKEGILLITEDPDLTFTLPYREEILPGKNYLLFFRPQDTKINIKTGSSTGRNTIKGEILSAEYSGRALTAEYKWKERVLKTETTDTDNNYRNIFKKGDRIEVSVNPGKCWLINNST